MGSVANDFSTLSWPGKVADNPKPFDVISAGKELLTREDLAEFEAHMFELIHEIAEKIASDHSDEK